MQTRIAKNERATQLTQLVRHWRRRADITTYQGLARTSRRGPGLTQADLAKAMGRSARWLGRLERGESADYSADFLDRCATALRLSPVERHTLYMLATGHPPAVAPVPASDLMATMDDALQRFLGNQGPHPAVVTDVAWNVIGYNAPLLDWFPWAAHQANYMRWTFQAPEAREQLVDWEQRWAGPALAQIRYELANHPGSEALRRLKDDILDGSPSARAIWDRPEVIGDIDGDLRSLRLPCHQGREVTVRVMALRPMRSTTLRMTVLMREA